MNPRPSWLPFVVAGFALFLVLGSATGQTAEPSRSLGNRLTYLDETDPFYVHRDFPKLTTPQWVGESGVEAVVILAIDDMREPQKYEAFLRPILERLKQIDGRAPVSIFCNALDPGHPSLQSWLKEGLSLEIHTLAHPCPCLAKGDFAAAANTYHGCVDLLNHVPGNKPVAFRMPCCDSMNSPSPRFYAEIFNRTNAAGQFLTIDSSVMNLSTPKDKSLARALVVDADGREKFRKYLPSQTNATTRVSMKSFVTTIEDYPYPYVIGGLCWEFPAMVPSDWEAHNLHGSTNPVTVADWKAALDIAVLKQGVFSFIFHPHGWIRSEQLVDFIDYAVQKHGRKVKFLNFREAQERLDTNLLAGNPLRSPGHGKDNGVRLLDLNNDGHLDVVIGNERIRKTRLWDARQRAWSEKNFPASVAGVKFGILESNRVIALQAVSEGGSSVRITVGAWEFTSDRWTENNRLLEGWLSLKDQAVFTLESGQDQGVRLHDVDNDGRCELIVGNERQNAVFAWLRDDKAWKKLPYALPVGTAIVDSVGRDAGLRFVDVNEDGYDDVLFSNERTFSLHQFVSTANQRLSWKIGWNDEVVVGQRGDANAIPMIVRGGTHGNNGAWFHSRHLWVQNEDTAHLPDKVDRRSFKQLLTADQPPPKSPAESLACIKVRAGFKVELVASEPLVMDPIALDWSADGKLWVVEMGDYPSGLDGKGKPGGNVRFLEDTNADGRYDKSTVFLDGLNFPTGLIPWRNGVIVSAAPEIFYAEDADGDGKADLRQTLFTGFVEGNQQHRVNGFDYGLDNWIYGANGDSGGTVQRYVPPHERVVPPMINIRNRDFRFRPDHFVFEAVAGQTQYGRHRDDWGNWFGNNNPTWLWHYFLPEHYLARNPQLAVKTTKQILANYPNSTRLYPVSRTQQRFNDPHQFNHVTSGNSATPYRDELFGPELAASVFISDPVHNLVHREVLEPHGVTFKSHRASDEQQSEFLASSDNWFRPIMLKTGPDGALYIADMYRLVLEHPEWITKDIQQRLDLRAGDDRGRIYRVYPEKARLRSTPRLDRFDTSGLVAALDSPNGWQRDTAQRLLVHRADKAAVEPLEQLVTASKNPKGRLQAICALDGLNALRTDIIKAALNDAHPAVRENAVRVSESLLAAQPSLIEALARLVDDPSPRVRYQLAFTLGECPSPPAAEALTKLAETEDGNIMTAVLSSAPRHAKTMLAQIESMPSASRARQLKPHLEKLVSSPVNIAAAGAIIERTNMLSVAQRAERANVLAQYTEVEKLKGDTTKGAALFLQHCAQCHRFKGEGTEVGPDLGMMAGKPLEAFVVAILDPNAAMEARYQNYTATLRDGREVSGIIGAETVTSLTLRNATGKDEILLRTDIRELTASGISLMPEGLEQALPPQAVADLIKYLNGSR